MCQIFLESQRSQNSCFCGQMCVLACRLELKWSQDKSIHKVFTCFVCVLMMCQTGGGALERVQIFILAEGLKIDFFFGHYQVEKANFL